MDEIFRFVHSSQKFEHVMVVEVRKVNSFIILWEVIHLFHIGGSTFTAGYLNLLTPASVI